MHRLEQDALRSVIREAREAQGLSQRALSLKLGMAPTYLARVERGERVLDVVEFIDLARVLGVEPTTLFADLLAAVRT